MRSYMFFLFLAAAVFGFAGPAQGLVGEQPAPRIATMATEDLRPGMKGYGLSVFAGTEPEPFEVEILGVLKNAYADGDMIIVKLDHGQLLNIGGVAGMSGSPIFIEDKLIGAFAYGWSFQVRAIGGVTPIGEMLEVMDLVTKEPQIGEDERIPSTAHWPEAERALSAWNRHSPVTFAQSELAAIGVPGMDDPAGSITMKPLMTPLMVGTRSPQVMESVKEMFAGSNFLPVMAGMQSAAGGNRTGEPAYDDVQLVNGGAISVVLCEGDFEMAALGTTTYVEGDRVIAFGHPMFALGASDAPISVSEVVAVVPSLMSPFKLGNRVKEVGALRQDRRSAIGAIVGERAAMVPMKLRLHAEEANTDREFNFRLWKNREFLPMISAICIMEALAAVRLEGPMNAQLTYTVTLDSGRKMKKEQYLSAPDMIGMRAAMQMMFELSGVVNNRFEPVGIRSIDAKITMGSRQKVMALERIVKGKETLRAGEEYRGEAYFTRWREARVRVPIRVRIPEDLKPGSYQIHVIDGPSRTTLEREFRPELVRAESLDDVLRQRDASFPTNSISIVLIDPSEQLVISGQTLHNLPASVAQTTRATVRDEKLTSTVKARKISEQIKTFDAMVAGATVIPITVIEKRN